MTLQPIRQANEAPSMPTLNSSVSCGKRLVSNSPVQPTPALNHLVLSESHQETGSRGGGKPAEARNGASLNMARLNIKRERRC